jgi:hypothetical protein
MKNDTYGFLDFAKKYIGALGYELFVDAMFGKASSQVLAHYPATNGDPFSQFTLMGTDYLFGACSL